MKRDGLHKTVTAGASSSHASQHSDSNNLLKLPSKFSYQCKAPTNVCSIQADLNYVSWCESISPDFGVAVCPVPQLFDRTNMSLIFSLSNCFPLVRKGVMNSNLFPR